MLRLYEILKTSKTGIAPDLWTRLAAEKMAGDGGKVRELTGELPLTFKANGTPLIDYIISGNMEQTGTPTPENPITPQETGDRTGNLCDMGNPRTINVRDTDVFVGTNQEISVTGTATANGGRNIPISEYIKLEAGTYTFSALGSYTGIGVFLEKKTDNSILCSVIMTNQTATFTVEEDIECYVGINVSIGTTYNATIKIMLNLSSTAFPYEPYGYKIPILSASTTTPVYWGEVETTRRIKKLVLTGEENITQHSVQNDIVGVRIPTPSSVLGASIVICSHYEGVLWPVYNGYRRYGIVASNPSSGNAIVYMSAPDSEHNTLSTFVQWIKDQYTAGTPITIWYVLTEPTTGIVNEPIRKIGDYADSISMEQAGVQIPTTNGTTVIDVETVLKPSKMYIKYKE